VDACDALEASVHALLAQAGGIDAIAHDLHPDFHSTRLAQQLAVALNVPCHAVQHHHAHIGVVVAEQGIAGPVIGVALDGVGLGTDGTAWGGELLLVDGAHCERIDHLPALALPGGDVAAREPWRMAAAALHAIGRADAIAQRFAPVVGMPAASMLRTMLDRDLNCPRTTAAGRWFDAIAGLLGLSVRQSLEADAAIALERLATAWLAEHPAETAQQHDLDLRMWLAYAADARDDDARSRVAACFHLALAEGLARSAARAAAAAGTSHVVLGGGCFFNRILAERLPARLRAMGLNVHLPRAVNCGDAGLALGQAWVAAQLGVSARAADQRAEV
jgi:hydrogenase maturation protein HypF